MQTKLTLRLNRQLIESAKMHAKKSRKSLSQMVAEYFALLTADEVSDLDISPSVANLKGVLKNARVGLEDYRKHLEEKHL